MTSKRLYPHFTSSVKAFQFLNITNPNLITSYTDLSPYDNENLFWLDTVHAKRFDDFTFENSVLIALLKKEGKLTFDWNTIVARSSDSLTDVQSYLSITYWDTLIHYNEPFEKLRIRYSSTYEVKPSEDVTSVEVEYLDHDVYEGVATEGFNRYQRWRTHDNLFREISGTLYPKTSWVMPSTPVVPVTDNSNEDFRVSTWSSDTSDYSVDISKNTEVPSGYPRSISSTYKDSSGNGKSYLDKAEYRGIPDCRVSGCKLIVSPRYGVEFYDPLNGKIYNQNMTLGAPIVTDSDVKGKNYLVYRFEGNVLLFYVPETYEAWISCKKAELDSSNFETWQSLWRVGDDSLKVVVPSYFGIIPFVFMQRLNEWRVSNALKLCDSVSDLFDSYNDNDINKKTSLTTDTSDIQAYVQDLQRVSKPYVSIPVEVFFNTIEYLYPYMQNIIMGYTNSNDYSESLARYFYAQLYLSYHTFVQALRLDEFYGKAPQMCDCGIKVGKYFIPYSQDFVTKGDSSSKKTSYAIEVGEGFEVDNMLAYYNSALISLYSGVSKSTSEFSDIQMRHGIVVGWDGNKYVQLQ